MITSLHIANVATFTGAPVEIGPLKKLNYFFGGNGSGKTTISRVIEQPGDFPQSTLSWDRGTELDTLVYNCEFVRENFVEDASLPGIFTLGSDNVNALKEIERATSELDRVVERRGTLRDTLEGTDTTTGKKTERADRFEQFQVAAWQRKKRYEGVFKKAFVGSLQKRSFASRLVSTHKAMEQESGPVQDLDELTHLAAELFGEKPEKEKTLSPLDGTRLGSLHQKPVLAMRVIGKEDVAIAALIKKLGNSDWVKTGREYSTESEGRCPFCQQDTPGDFERHLNEFFDEEYATRLDEIQTIGNNYASSAENLKGAGRMIYDSPHRYLDRDRFLTTLVRLEQLLERNVARTEQKRHEPSRVVELDPIDAVITELNTLIDEANEKVRQQHQRVSNYESEQKGLIARVWRYLVQDMEPEILSYRKDAKDLTKAVLSLEEKLTELQGQIQEKTSVVRGLERLVTSTKPTVDLINALLQSYGFLSFQIASTADGKAYRLVRRDGITHATRSLSEGERTFVAFLYFYHLVSGTHDSAAGVSEARVVVLDDPVSSLDSEVLFIVSALIRKLAEEVGSKSGTVRQLLLLTHNVFFHKEVTFGYQGRGDVSYWTVRKTGRCSTVVNHKVNPVKTTYQLLWDELKRARDETSPVPTVHNAMRRILEYYFTLLGGWKLDDLASQFDGKDQVICASLIKWAHDGSHAFFDDPSHTMSMEDVNRQMDVFKRVFEQTDQIAHYEMMMR